MSISKALKILQDVQMAVYIVLKLKSSLSRCFYYNKQQVTLKCSNTQSFIKNIQNYNRTFQQSMKK